MGSSNIHAKEKDENTRISPSLQYQSKLGITTLRGAFFKDKIYYKDDLTLSSNSESNTYQSQLEHEWKLAWSKWKMKSGLEFQHFQLLVNAYGGKVNENRASGYILLRYDPISRLHINLNFRQGLVQNITVPFTPALGVSYQAWETKASVTSFKINISKGYRVPGFNDRFWVPGGNPYLKPESSTNYEAGLVYKRYLNKATWETELTFYHMLVNDWIQWLPKGKTSIWTAQNIFQVRAEGLEFSSKYTFNYFKINYSLGGAYSYNSSVVNKTYEPGTFPVGNQLIYVPLHKVVFYFESNLSSWMFITNFSFNGYRYTTSTNDSYLPAYSLLNIYAGKKFKFNQVELQLILKVNNVLNQEYQNMENIAVPMRNYSVSIRMNYIDKRNF
jgi:iron complex outermembrane receptor protein